MGIADADHDSNGIHRQVRTAQQFTGFVHTAAGNIVVQEGTGLLIEYLSKVVGRQVDHIRQALNGQVFA